MKRKGDEYKQSTYKPSWQVLCLAGLVWALIIAVIVLWTGAARAQAAGFVTCLDTNLAEFGYPVCED
jgi:hypothetical protein